MMTKHVLFFAPGIVARNFWMVDWSIGTIRAPRKGENMVHVITMTKHELVALGYGASRAQDIIRRAKLLMVRKGVAYYKSPKLGRVPVTAVEEILGLQISTRTLAELAKTMHSEATKEK